MWRKRKPSSPFEVWPVRPDQLLANERRQPWRDVGFSGASVWTAPRWNVSPSIEPRSSTPPPLVRAGRVVPGGAPAGWAGQPRRRRRRLPWPATRGMKSGLPPAVCVILARGRRGSPRGDELIDVCVGQRGEPERYRPGGTALAELRPRHAEQQDRRARWRGARRARSRSRNAPRPTGRRRERRREGARPQRARASCGTPRRSPQARSTRRLSPSSERIAAAASSSKGRGRAA